MWPESPRKSDSAFQVYLLCKVVFDLNSSSFLLNGTPRYHQSDQVPEDWTPSLEKLVKSYYVEKRELHCMVSGR